MKYIFKLFITSYLFFAASVYSAITASSTSSASAQFQAKITKPQLTDLKTATSGKPHAATKYTFRVPGFIAPDIANLTKASGYAATRQCTIGYIKVHLDPNVTTGEFLPIVCDETLATQMNKGQAFPALDPTKEAILKKVKALFCSPGCKTTADPSGYGWDITMILGNTKLKDVTVPEFFVYDELLLEDNADLSALDQTEGKYFHMAINFQVTVDQVLNEPLTDYINQIKTADLTGKTITTSDMFCTYIVKLTAINETLTPSCTRQDGTPVIAGATAFSTELGSTQAPAGVGFETVPLVERPIRKEMAN